MKFFGHEQKKSPNDVEQRYRFIDPFEKSEFLSFYAIGKVFKHIFASSRYPIISNCEMLRYIFQAMNRPIAPHIEVLLDISHFKKVELMDVNIQKKHNKVSFEYLIQPNIPLLSFYHRKTGVHYGTVESTFFEYAIVDFDYDIFVQGMKEKDGKFDFTQIDFLKVLVDTLNDIKYKQLFIPDPIFYNDALQMLKRDEPQKYEKLLEFQQKLDPNKFISLNLDSILYITFELLEVIFKKSNLRQAIPDDALSLFEQSKNIFYELFEQKTSANSKEAVKTFLEILDANLNYLSMKDIQQDEEEFFKILKEVAGEDDDFVDGEENPFNKEKMKNKRPGDYTLYQ